MFFQQLIVLIIFFTSNSLAMFRRPCGIGSPKKLSELIGLLGGSVLGNTEWERQSKKMYVENLCLRYGIEKKTSATLSLDNRRKKRHTKFR